MKISGLIKSFGKQSDAWFATAIIFIISILLLPVPPRIIDFLFSLSIAFSIIVLITVLFVPRAIDFSSFPSVLLVLTMMRLALNIASTRLILSAGHMGTSAAGHIIEAFGKFVMQGSLIIGAIVFTILTIINFIVITKGSGRIAEVSARFSLDSMPGKQMAIDADLAAGSIDEGEAKLRRVQIEKESTFFGTMDGASKFVRGDAIAGILITFINFIAGMIIGVAQRDMSAANAAHTYTILTIGDGLISQIPALIVSIAAGLLVTKSNDSGSADKAILHQLGQYPKAVALTSLFLFMIGLIPGMPLVPFFIMGGLVACSSYLLWSVKEEHQETTTASDIADGIATQDAAEQESDSWGKVLSKELKIDNIRIELGSGILKLVNPISQRVKMLRKQLVQELGFITPSIRICDNLLSRPDEYVIKIKEIKCAVGKVRLNKKMVINTANKPISLPGEPAKEPVFGLEAVWIDQELKEEARRKHYSIIEPEMVIITHLGEIIKENISELMTYNATQELVERISDDHKQLISDTIPTKLEIGTLQVILQKLLAEKISIRNLPLIIESIIKVQNSNASTDEVVQHVRIALSRQISAEHTNEQGYMPVAHLSAKWEEAFHKGIIDNKIALPPTQIQEFINQVKESFNHFDISEEGTVLIVSAKIRPHIRSIVERFRDNLIVLAQNEIHPKARIKSVGNV